MKKNKEIIFSLFLQLDHHTNDTTLLSWATAIAPTMEGGYISW